MIGSEHEALVDRSWQRGRPRRLGGPLATLVLLVGVWVAGRAILWEDPFSARATFAKAAPFAAKATANGSTPDAGSHPFLGVRSAFGEGSSVRSANRRLLAFGDNGPTSALSGYAPSSGSPHHALWGSALLSDDRGAAWRARRLFREAVDDRQAAAPVFPGTPPFVVDRDEAAAPRAIDRWSLGAWAFFREGSNVSNIAPGPAPVYGASQAGAILQYRMAPRSAPDPRLYARATRALIDQPESEVAVGVSARPAASVPVRFAAEVRATDNRFTRDIRPAAFAISELPPVALPLDMTAEIYAAAGYVGGEAETGFIDGQATVTHPLTSFDLKSADDVRISLGAGAWGGAQRGAHRVDVGPTMRVDMALGSVPARLSVDYRERVGGDASPASGVAATLSTQF